MATFMTADDAVLLMVDHQSGLFQTVKDIPVQELRANAVALVKAAKLLGVPVITTASEPKGPNGPLMPELHKADRHATFVPRDGEVNAWDAPAFAQAVRATSRRNVVVAGVWTSVCVAFVALSAKAEGFGVHAVMDASGDASATSALATMARLAQAGVVPTSTTAVIAELQKTWKRPDADAFAAIYGAIAPNFAAVAESFAAAQSA